MRKTGLASLLLLPTFVMAVATHAPIENITVPSLNTKSISETGGLISVIKTDAIKLKSGTASGVSTVNLSLAKDADFPIVVKGKTIKPGESADFNINLSDSHGSIEIPFYGLSTGEQGKSEFVLESGNITAAVCPDSFTFNHQEKICKKLDIQELFYSCPDSSWQLNDDLKSCTRLNVVNLESCPEGYISDHKGTCELKETSKQVPLCPENYTFDEINDICQKVDSFDAAITCDEGYSYQARSNQCELISTIDVVKSCPEGTILNKKDNVCQLVSEIKAKAACGDEFTYDEKQKQCVSQTTKNATRFCPEGYFYTDWSKACVNIKRSKSDYQCPTGYALVKATKQCEKIEKTALKQGCDSGFVVSGDGKTCSKMDTVKARTFAVCKSGVMPDCEKEIIRRCPSGYGLYGNVCRQNITLSAKGQCPQGFKSLNGQCIKKTTKKAVLSCPDGFTKNESGMCINKKTVEFVWRCPKGYLETDNGKCVQTVAKNYSWSCPEGAINLNNGMCQTALEKPWNYSCSQENYQLNDTKTHCEKVEVGVKSYSCDTNEITKISDEIRLDGEKCIRLTLNPAQYGCPSGFKLQTDGQCERLTVSTINVQCPENFSLIDGQCVNELTVDTIKSCKSGLHPSDNQCETIVATAATCNDGDCACPSGSVLNKATAYCERVITDKFVLSCPENFEFHEGLCRVKNHVLVKSPDICPPSMQQTDGTCAIKQTIGSIPSCELPFYENDGKCQSLMTVAVGAGAGAKNTESRSFSGMINFVPFDVHLSKSEFASHIETINVVAAIKDDTCQLTGSKLPNTCNLLWGELPNGLISENNVIKGVFTNAGNFNLPYQLFLTTDKGEDILVKESTLSINVQPSNKPKMTQVVTQFTNFYTDKLAINNSSKNEELQSITVSVEPRDYVQKVNIAELGVCFVEVGKTQCNIKADALRNAMPLESQFTYDFAIEVNSINNGWTVAELETTNLVVANDFTGPKVTIAQFVGGNETESLTIPNINSDITLAPGHAFIAFNPSQNELTKTQEVNLQLISMDSKPNSNQVEVNGKVFNFDAAPAVMKQVNNSVLKHYERIEDNNIDGYFFNISSLPAGNYRALVSAVDSYGNQSQFTRDNIFIKPSKPDIKIFHGNTELVTTAKTQAIMQLDDINIVTHNGIIGDAKITRVLMDDIVIDASVNKGFYQQLTGKKADLVAGQQYQLRVDATDSLGQQSSLTVPVIYRNVQFGINRISDTVLHKIENLDVKVRRIAGSPCKLYDSSIQAKLSAKRDGFACYLSWDEVPQGLTTRINDYDANAFGEINSLGKHALGYSVYLATQNGEMDLLQKSLHNFNVISADPIKLVFNNNGNTTNDSYLLPLNRSQIAQYNGLSSRGDVEIRQKDSTGLSKVHSHLQTNYGDKQAFSGVIEAIGQQQLWEKKNYTVQAYYKQTPDKVVEKTFNLISIPDPFMQVKLDVNYQQVSGNNIDAKVSLGKTNIITHKFAFDKVTMGTDWDVYLAILNGKNFQPISNVSRVNDNGQAMFSLPAGAITERHAPLYAVARAVSPHKGLDIERVSIPHKMAKITDTGFGQLVVKRAKSRTPALFNVRFDGAINENNISWQQRTGSGKWTAIPNTQGQKYISIHAEKAQTLQVRAQIKQGKKVSHSDIVALTSYNKPKIRLEYPDIVLAGQDIPVNVIDTNESMASETAIEWSMDGKNWQQSGSQFTVPSRDKDFNLQVRMKYLNTGDAEEAGWVNKVGFMKITNPSRLSLTVDNTQMVEISRPFQLNMKVDNALAKTKVPVKSQWKLANGKVIDGETLSTTVSTDMLDNQGRVSLIASAWLDGFKDQTITQSEVLLHVFDYAFPTDNELNLNVATGAKVVPAQGFATLDMPYINLQGVEFSYDWLVDESAIEIVKKEGNSISFNVFKPGVHEIVATLSDNRGNFVQKTEFLDAIEPSKLQFKVTENFSNKHKRAPLTVSMYPTITEMLPNDSVSEYKWSINGETKSASGTNGAVLFDNLADGEYQIALDVLTKFGQKGRHVVKVNVSGNKAPSCKPMVNDTGLGVVINANCRDNDGSIRYYRWTVNGNVFSPYGSQVRFAKKDFPNAKVILEAVDDAGAIGKSSLSL